MYSTYSHFDNQDMDCEANPSDNEKIIIIGGGPNRIGQELNLIIAAATHASHLKRWVLKQ